MLDFVAFLHSDGVGLLLILVTEFHAPCATSCAHLLELHDAAIVGHEFVEGNDRVPVECRRISRQQQ